jgi:D-alanyl-lipoteichoic acid acyltransferase DltB (MBOAT superfamily)
LRRWHISLSTWFRDYVYIPLGGDRHGKARWVAAILITFLLSGLWHGANWTFVAWGAVHGVLLLVSRFLERLPKALRTVLTFHLVTLGWIYFRAPSLGDAHALMARLFTGPWTAALPAAYQGSQLALAGLGVGALLVADLRLRPPPSPALRWAALLIGALLVLNGRPEIDLPFIYFQF